MDRRTVLRALSASSLSIAVPAWARAAADTPLQIDALYNGDLTLSALAIARDGTRVVVRGFMAPPLKAESRFFVLTRRPMSVCPFCDAGAAWPDDILAVTTKRVVAVEPFNRPLLARGVLVIGDYQDPETGFLSRMRIRDARYEPA